MNTKLKRMFEQNKLCSIYYDEDETDIFLIGWIVAMDSEFFIIECVNSRGYLSGFACHLIDSIIKIETNNKFLEIVEKLLIFNKQERGEMIVFDNDCVGGFLEYLIKNKRICFIEVCESNNIDGLGYVKSFKKNEIIISRVNEYGQFDGEECINLERVSSITMGNDEQVKLEILCSF